MAILGQWERGIPMVRKAIALLPDHPGYWHIWLSFNHYRKHEYEEALAEALKINMPGIFWSHAALAAAYGQLGRKAEAAAAVRDLLKLYPTYPEKVWDEFRKFNISPELALHYVEGLRKAGLEVPDEPEEDGFRKEAASGE